MLPASPSKKSPMNALVARALAALGKAKADDNDRGGGGASNRKKATKEDGQQPPVDKYTLSSDDDDDDDDINNYDGYFHTPFRHHGTTGSGSSGGSRRGGSSVGLESAAGHGEDDKGLPDRRWSDDNNAARQSTKQHAHHGSNLHHHGDGTRDRTEMCAAPFWHPQVTKRASGGVMGEECSENEDEVICLGIDDTIVRPHTRDTLPCFLWTPFDKSLMRHLHRVKEGYGQPYGSGLKRAIFSGVGPLPISPQKHFFKKAKTTTETGGVISSSTAIDSANSSDVDSCFMPEVRVSAKSPGRNQQASARASPIDRHLAQQPMDCSPTRQQSASVGHSMQLQELIQQQPPTQQPASLGHSTQHQQPIQHQPPTQQPASLGPSTQQQQPIQHQPPPSTQHQQPIHHQPPTQQPVSVGHSTQQQQQSIHHQPPTQEPAAVGPSTQQPQQPIIHQPPTQEPAAVGPSTQQQQQQQQPILHQPPTQQQAAVEPSTQQHQPIRHQPPTQEPAAIGPSTQLQHQQPILHQPPTQQPANVGLLTQQHQPNYHQPPTQQQQPILHQPPMQHLPVQQPASYLSSHQPAWVGLHPNVSTLQQPYQPQFGILQQPAWSVPQPSANPQLFNQLLSQFRQGRLPDVISQIQQRQHTLPMQMIHASNQPAPVFQPGIGMQIRTNNQISASLDEATPPQSMPSDRTSPSHTAVAETSPFKPLIDPKIIIAGKAEKLTDSSKPQSMPSCTSSSHTAVAETGQSRPLIDPIIVIAGKAEKLTNSNRDRISKLPVAFGFALDDCGSSKALALAATENWYNSGKRAAIIESSSKKGIQKGEKGATCIKKAVTKDERATKKNIDRIGGKKKSERKGNHAKDKSGMAEKKNKKKKRKRENEWEQAGGENATPIGRSNLVASNGTPKSSGTLSSTTSVVKKMKKIHVSSSNGTPKPSTRTSPSGTSAKTGKSTKTSSSSGTPNPSEASSDGRVAAILISSSDSPPGLPNGWTMKTFQRMSGKTSGTTDSYWYTPQLKLKFRSKKGCTQFIEILNEPGIDGDESMAFNTFKKRGFRV